MHTFVQIHNFYQHYLNRFYDRNSELTKASFDRQIQALLRDGFSANHLMAPYMPEDRYKSHFIIANNFHAQLAWLQANDSTEGITAQNWFYEILRRQIDRLNPDILYLSEPIQLDSRFVRLLKKRPKLILGWRAADIPEVTDWSEIDVLLSGITKIREFALKLGAKASHHFFPGFPTWIYDEIKEIQPVSDLVFSGSWTQSNHVRRNKMISALVDASLKDDFSFSLYLSGQLDTLDEKTAALNKGERYGVDMHKALRTGRIAFDARANHSLTSGNPSDKEQKDILGNETLNMRLFEATGSRIMLLAEHFDNVKDFFEPGKEVVTFSSMDDLFDKIKYYSTHVEERRKITEAGWKRCMEEYRMEKRTEELDDIINMYLDRKNTKSFAMKTEKGMNAGNKETLKSVVQLMQEANKRIIDKNIEEAFELLIKAKGYKTPVENLDLLRAICFLEMKNVEAARQAIYEELAHFQHNPIAKKLLGEIGDITVDKLFDDQEFYSILPKIRIHTMLGEARLFSLFTIAREVCRKNIEGNFVECGVARGGSTGLLGYVIKQHSRSDRNIYAFDTFEGMPEPTEKDKTGGVDAEETGWGTGSCAGPIDNLVDIGAQLKIGNLIVPVKGLFEKTLPEKKKEIGKIAFMHLDADWYDSTMTVLREMYDQIVPGGFLQIDDYNYWEGCREAVNDFQKERGIQFKLNPIDSSAVWLQKE